MPEIRRQSECNWRLQTEYNPDGTSAGRVARFFTEDCMKHELLRKVGVLVTDPWNPIDYRRAVTCSTNMGAYTTWERNYEKLKPLISESCADVPQEDILYFVAPGPSLTKNMHELKNITHGKVIGMNIVPKFGVKCDYYASMDYCIKPETCFNADTPKMVGMFSPQVNWEIPYADVFSRRVWGFPALVMPLFDKMREEYPHIPMVTATPNVSFMAIEWACKYMNPKAIVLVGFDFCGYILKDGETCRMHPDGHDDFKPEGDWKEFTTLGIDGEPVLYLDLYRRIIQHHIPLFWFLVDRGIRVINATEGGILWENCACLHLKTAVQLCNMYGETKNDELLPSQKVEAIKITDIAKDPFYQYLDFMAKENEDASTEKEIQSAVV